MPVPWKRASARSIVPSPPRTTAMSASPASWSANTSSTSDARATASRRAIAGATATALTCVTTAATLTDGIVDPALELGGECGVTCSLFDMDEVEDELLVAFRAGQARVYDAARLGSGSEQRLRHLAHHAALHRRVANHPLRRLGPPRLELWLDEHQRLPTW